MKEVIIELSQFAQNTKICAVYLKSANGLANLKFYYLEYKNYCWQVTDRVVNDDKFFKLLYKNKKISRNALLQWIEINIEKKEYVSINRVSFVVTKSLN